MPAAIEEGSAMNRRRTLLKTALAIAAGGARAHSGESHANTPAAARKEQKPWGIAGDARKARRRIVVGMSDDMRFTPERIEVRLGETVKFVVRNSGQVMHEFVIGTREENARHAELMIKHPDMEHDEPYMTHVAPGRTGEIVWTFNRTGSFEFACLIAGHYAAGMAGTIVVSAAAQARPGAARPAP
jgi:uncharacterized cupredoxin-like copper-binding protein